MNKIVLILLVSITLHGRVSISQIIVEKQELLSCDISNQNIADTNQTGTEICCNKTVENFRLKWNDYGYLVYYLSTLKKLNCPQFNNECTTQTYAFTEYSKLVYSYICNKTIFEDNCVKTKGTWEDKEVTNKTISSDKYAVNTNYDFLCTQLLYDTDSEQYNEIIEIKILFCEIVWCGFNSTDQHKTTWDCMPSGCRTSVIICIILCFILAIGIIMANIVIISVHLATTKLQNSQGCFKISLAVTGAIVGVIVIPTFAASIGMTSWGKSQADKVNSTVLNTDDYETSKFSYEYLNTVGFFTIQTLSCTIYMLLIAGIDRVLVVYCPLKYNKIKAEKCTVTAIIATWVLPILFAILPIVLDDQLLEYKMVASFLIVATGKGATIFYTVGILAPLVMLWIVTLMTYKLSRKHTVNRAKLRAHFSAFSGEAMLLEYRLARKLSAMVCSFTGSLIPATIVFLCTLFVDSIDYGVPEKLDPLSAAVLNSFEFLALLFLMCNSLWNLLIYNQRDEDFRIAKRKLLRQVICLRGCHDNESNTNLKKSQSRRKIMSNSTKSKSEENSPKHEETVLPSKYHRENGEPLFLPTSPAALPMILRHDIYKRQLPEKGDHDKNNSKTENN